MICHVCGYVMSDFDADCLRCRNGYKPPSKHVTDHKMTVYSAPPRSAPPPSPDFQLTLPQSAARYQDALIDRIADDPAIVGRVAAEGREWAMANYTPVAMARRFLAELGHPQAASEP